MSSWNIPDPPAPTGINTFGPESTTPQTVFNGKVPLPNTSVPILEVTVQRWWQSIYRTTTDAVGNQSFALQVTTGITNTTEQTQTFGEVIGAGTGAELAGISSTFSAEISQSTSYTESVSLEQLTTTTTTYQVDATQSQVSVDFWQLNEQYTVTFPMGFTNATATLINALPQFLPTTYPANVSVESAS